MFCTERCSRGGRAEWAEGSRPTPSTGGLGWEQERCKGSGPAQAPPWAQHERAFNELSEKLFYKNAKIKAPNVLGINYELAAGPCFHGGGGSQMRACELHAPSPGFSHADSLFSAPEVWLGSQEAPLGPEAAPSSQTAVSCSRWGPSTLDTGTFQALGPLRALPSDGLGYLFATGQ